MTDITKLQNGSDIRGIASEGVAGEDVDLTKERAGQIAGAFCYWLSKKVRLSLKMLNTVSYTLL